MADYSTTNYLIPAIKRRLMVPTTQATYQTADFLAVLNAELQASVVPLLMSVREEYFVATSDTAVTVGTAAYDIPSGAIGGDLRDVLMVASDGTTRNLLRLEPESVVGQPVTQGTPVGFVLQDEQVVLWPAPQNTNESLRFSYHRRPNTLVDVSAVGVIQSFNAITKNITASLIPAGVTAGSVVDLIKASPQFRALADSAAVTSTGGGVLGMSAALPTGLAVGDYVCAHGESPVAQVPLELQPILVLRACVVIAEALGDAEMAGLLGREFEEKKRAAMVLIGNRVKGEQRKMPNGMTRWRGTWSPWSY